MTCFLRPRSAFPATPTTTPTTTTTTTPPRFRHRFLPCGILHIRRQPPGPVGGVEAIPHHGRKVVRLVGPDLGHEAVLAAGGQEVGGRGDMATPYESCFFCVEEGTPKKSWGGGIATPPPEPREWCSGTSPPLDLYESS